METQVLGLSVDSVDSLRAWADSLGGITYPLLADFYPHGAVAGLYGVLRAEGYAERSLFVVDKSGVIRYVDVHAIDDQPDNEVLFAELARIEPRLARKWAGRPDDPARTALRLSGDVVVYCTQWCPSCRVAREWLSARGVRYVEIDIGRDRGAAAVVRGLAGGNEKTPTFDVRGTVIVGLDLDRLAEALGLSR